MKLFLKKYLRFFVLAFAFGLFVPHINPALFKADLTDNPYQEISDNSTGEDALEKALVAYHINTNKIVNDTLALLFDATIDVSEISMPPSGSNCEEENVSTYCLAVKLNDNLVQFEEFVASKKSVGFDSTSQEFTNIETLNDAIKVAGQESIVLEDQLAIANDALDLTLAVYNQIQIVYPLHKELRKMLDNLMTYRSNLADIRNLVELFPSKFNGATTTQCK